MYLIDWLLEFARIATVALRWADQNIGGIIEDLMRMGQTVPPRDVPVLWRDTWVECVRGLTLGMTTEEDVV